MPSSSSRTTASREDGLDFTKDDENINSQPFGRWRDRYVHCIEAVKRAEERTGEIKGSLHEDAAACFTEVTACREAYPNHYIKVNGYNARYTKQTIGLSFIVNRPKMEPGFRLDRTELNDRHVAYTMHFYAAETPHGTRYQGNGSGPEPD